MNRLKGGAVLPSEYFGVNSGNYFENPPMPDSFAYGTPVAQSFGVQGPFENMTGPNLGVYPTNVNQQTGGYTTRRRRRRTTRKNCSTRARKRCSSPRNRRTLRRRSNRRRRRRRSGRK